MWRNRQLVLSGENNVEIETQRLRKALRAGSLTIALSAVLAGCASDRRQVVPGPETVRSLTVLEVSRTAVPDVVEAVGTVRAAESAEVAAQLMGNIASVAVREGDSVRRGQVLAVIDDAQPRAGRDRAQAALAAAEHEVAAAESECQLAAATMKRYQELFDKKSASPQEFDEVKARFQGAEARRELARSGQLQAKAALAQAQTMLDYTRILAPFDGVVTERRVDPGAMATPGLPLLWVEKSGRFRLEATVNESDLRFLKSGQTAAVQVDALEGGRLSGKVVDIVPAVEAASRSFLVKVELPAQPHLRSGMFGRAYFPRGEREAIAVPRSALVSRGQLQGVYVLDGARVANLRYVTLGKADGDQVEVLSGLQPGERLVASPGTRELDGKRIE
jgi:RND family efflux transporter MFP subunit